MYCMCLLSAYYVAGTILGTADAEVTHDKGLPSIELAMTSLWETQPELISFPSEYIV